MAATSAKSIESAYLLQDKIGSGAFSDVYKATSRTDPPRIVAVKQIKKFKVKNKDDIAAEIAILEKLDHPHVIHLYEVFDAAEYTYLCMEFLGGGELFDRIVEKGSYTELDAAELLMQVLKAVNYLHDKHIVHRDLKPENLLCASTEEHTRIVISDFGLAYQLKDQETLTHPCGTPGYAAPEVLLKKPYAYKVDCFSIGVIAYILLCGYPPFFSETDDNAELFEMTVKGRWEFDSPDWDEMSQSSKEFIRGLMEMSQDKRWTSAEAAKHSWVLGQTSLTRDIHRRVSDNLEKYFVKRRWRLAFNAQRTINRMRVMTADRKRSDSDAKHEEDQSSTLIDAPVSPPSAIPDED